MKTAEELIASGTLPEIIARQTENIKAADAIFAKEDKATADELKQAVALHDENEKLGVKRAELEKVETARASIKKQKADLDAPAGVPFHKSDSGDDNRSALETPFSSGLKHITMESAGVGSVKEAELKAMRFGRFLFAGLFRHQKSIEWCRDNGIEIKAVNESVNEQGGVLVVPEFSAMLIRLIEQYGVFRRSAKTEPMGSDTKFIPRRTGGVTAYWTGEGVSITDSTPAKDNVQLVAKKLAALVIHSSEVAEDSILSIADDLAFEIGYAFAKAEDDAGFIGDGTSTYGGITGVTNKLKNLSGTIANIAGLFVGTGNAYSELTLADHINTMGLLPHYADGANCKWYCHKTYYYQVMVRVEAAAGGNTITELQRGARQPLFLGYPVEFAQSMPRTEANSQVSALFGDLNLAASFGDRRNITLFTDPYSRSANDQTQIRGTERIDIVVHDVGNASSSAASRVAGPVVGLITAAS